MYDDIGVHELMLRDEVRTGAFERALREVVRPHHSVLDFGCGSGILAFFAARLGARVVYAVERSPIIRVARALARDNGLDQVRFHCADHQTLALPEPVDVIVSDWMGHFVFGEWMLEALLQVRDRYLAPDGIMLPGQVSLRAALVRDPAVTSDRSCFRDRPYGFDFSRLADWPFRRVDPVQLAPQQLLEPVAELGVIDARRGTAPPRALTAVITPAAAATIYGVCGWFHAQLTDQVGFGTGPWDPPTHWRQLLFPVPAPIPVAPHTPVVVTIVPARDRVGDGPLWRWSVAAGDTVVEMDDFLHRGWSARPLEPGPLT